MATATQLDADNGYRHQGSCDGDIPKGCYIAIAIFIIGIVLLALGSHYASTSLKMARSVTPKVLIGVGLPLIFGSLIYPFVKAYFEKFPF